MKKSLLILLVLAIHWTTSGQEKLHVFTQTISKTFEIQEGITLEVNGEKALIKIKGTSSDKAVINLKLISKSLNKESAEQGLDIHAYKIDLAKGVLLVSNQISISKSKPTTDLILAVEMEISIPADMPFSVKNSYGQLLMEEVIGTKQILSSYGSISLLNIKGVTTLTSYYGDLTISELNGRTSLSLEFTPVELTGVSGFLNIKSSYSDILLTSINKIDAMSINASKSDVEFGIRDYKRYRYFTQADFGELNLQSAHDSAIKKDISNRLVWTSGSPALPLIEIKSYFGNITLKLE